MAGYPPKGLIIALITPLNEEGGIDWPSMERLIERVLPFADGLLIGEGLAGEGLLLSYEARLELLRGATDRIAGRKPLLLCPTSATPEETLRMIEAMGEEGPEKESLYWMDLPLWYHSNRKLPQFYREWALRTTLPILLYNHPRLISGLNRSLKRNNLRTAVVKRLAENEQVVGLVQAGSLERTIHYQRAVRSRREFRFYDGEEGDFLNQPSSTGVISRGANLLPAEWKEIVSTSLDPEEDPARSIHLWGESRRLRGLHAALGPNPAPGLKLALQRLGVIDRAKTMAQGGELPSPESKIGVFLRENFPLPSSP
ncbi:MAG: dihydrodipicolinate synthase family protein [Deltaproteobacteria bacterium]|nr:dihydrodipicolinate synthase family protein [Deltaproteobacteria bacterium]